MSLEIRIGRFVTVFLVTTQLKRLRADTCCACTCSVVNDAVGLMFREFFDFIKADVVFCLDLVFYWDWLYASLSLRLSSFYDDGEN